MESFVASSRVIKGALVGRGKRNSDTEHGERRKGREKNYSKRGDPWKGKVSPPMESVKETGVTYRRSLPQSAMLRFSLRPARSFDPPRAIYICTFCQEISPFFHSRHPLPFVALTSRIFARLCRSKKSSSGFLKMTFNHSQGARIMTDNDKFFSVSGLTEKKSLDSLHRRDRFDCLTR